MAVFQLSTPIAFIIFNRPDTTKVVFEAIRKAKPPQLFVIADGPRLHKDGEIDLCMQTRAVIDQVDWPCQVYTNYSEVNLGCKKRVSTGLDWVFQHVEQAIILEDDCLPDPSFFQFCEELLDKYKYDTRIMMISGNNFQFGERRSNQDYYFSHYNHIWGWATWKRAWNCYDGDLKIWEQIRDGNWLMDILHDELAAQYWYQRFEETYTGKVDSWAYGWTFACWVGGGLTILPNVNLVSNIGFGENATHTKNASPLANIPVDSIKFPMRHPQFVIRDVKADKKTNQIVFNINSIRYAEISRVESYKSQWLDLLLFHNTGITSVLTRKKVGTAAVFGTGKVAVYLHEDLKRENIQLVTYLDNDQSKQHSLLRNVPVNEPNWLIENYKRIDAVIVSIEGNHDTEIIRYLVEISKGAYKVYSWKELLRMKRAED